VAGRRGEGRRQEGNRRGRRQRACKPYSELTLDERWDELLTHALQIGLATDAFWNTTPRELQLLTKAYWKRTQREGLFVAWHVAALSRAQRLPSLESVLADPLTEEELRIEKEEAEQVHREMTAIHERAMAAQAEVKADG
jgi:hypothetical protein